MGLREIPDPSQFAAMVINLINLVVARDVNLRDQRDKVILSYNAAHRRISALEQFVRTHYEQRGDDRCHLDDQKLYHDVLGIEPDPYVTALPPYEEMIESCHRYIRQRQHPDAHGKATNPEGLTIAQLVERVKELSSESLTFEKFAEINRDRCVSPSGFNHQLYSWSLSDWFTALVGEVGEAANIAKKLNRVRDGITGNKETETELREKLRSEIADAFIYLDLLAQSQGFSLEEAVVETFNKKSDQIGSPHKL